MYLPSLVVTPNIIFNSLITSPGIDNLIKNAGGLVDLVTILGNKAGIVDSASATITCTQNQTTAVFANRATAQTVQLPAWSGQRFPIYIEKTAANTAVITIQRAGSDTINNPFDSSAVPVGTTFTLRVTGESCWLIPDGLTNIWHVSMVNDALTQLSCFVHSNTSQSSVVSGTVIAFNTEIYDRANSWNNTTFRYTALVQGIFQFHHTVTTQSASNTETTIKTRRFNSSNVEQVGLRSSGIVELSTNPVTLVGGEAIPMNVGDYVNYTASTGSGNISIYGNAITPDCFTHVSVACLGRTA